VRRTLFRHERLWLRSCRTSNLEHGKPSQRHLMVTRIQLLAERGELQKDCHDAFFLKQELSSQSTQPHFVVRGRFSEIFLGRMKELNLHCFRRERTRSNTSAAGNDFINPASKAALRRCTSSSQARSVSGSATPSSSSSSARNNRSCSGRAKLRISFSISETDLAITLPRDGIVEPSVSLPSNDRQRRTQQPSSYRVIHPVSAIRFLSSDRCGGGIARRR
jgi:hypothetical protein